MGRDEPSDDASQATVEASASCALPGPQLDERPISPVISPDIESWPKSEPGRYLVEGEFARGGRGRILKAHDRQLDRDVALKELLSEDGQSKARFAREALITARLQHPAIIPIFDVGRWSSGKPFFAMKMVALGHSMAEAIHRAKGLEDRLALLPALIAVADAVAYAHQQGVLHRDLKPSNILLGPFGETMVIDWGLATDLRAGDLPARIDGAYRLAALPLTLTGSVMGTPLYMAPEQSSGRRLDERADVYALGAILYHLLAGVPPYADSTPTNIVERLQLEPPEAIEEIEPRIPKELAAIVLKSLARNPRDRYPTAQAFAEDLKRFQTGQLVRAYHYPRWKLACRWVHRHRAPLLVAAALLTVSSVAGVAAVRRIVRAQSMAESRSNDLVLFQARSLLDKDPTASVAWLKSFPAFKDHADAVRDIALRADALGIARHVFRRKDVRFSSVDFSPDGRLFAAVGRNREIQVVDVESGARLASLPHSSDTQGMVRGVLFSPDGRSVLFSDWDNRRLYLWQFLTGELRTAEVANAEVDDRAFSPDGAWIAVAFKGRAEVWVWNLSTGDQRFLAGHHRKVKKLAFSPAGQLISSSADETVRIWTLPTGESRALQAASSGLNALAVFKDEKVAALDAEGAILIWDFATGRLKSSHRYNERLHQLAFSPDGARLAGASEDGTLRILDISTGTTATFVGHQKSVLTVAFSFSGRQVATGGSDGTVRVWDLDSGAHQVLRGHSAPVHQILFSRNDAFIASSSSDGTSRLWRVPAEERVGRVLSGHSDAAMHATFSSDGQRLATGSRDGTVRIWSPATGASTVLRGHTDLVYRTAFSPDGQTLASGGLDRVVRLWDLPTQTSRALAAHQGIVWAVKFSHHGDRLATAGADGKVALWNAGSGALAASRQDAKELYNVAFSPDDRLLASAGLNGLAVWNLESGEVSLHRPGDEATTVAFSPDGRRLAWCGNGTWLRVLDLSSGAISEYSHHPHHLRTLAYSPNGKQIASGDETGAITLRDLNDHKSKFLKGHRGQVFPLVFSPDGSLLASGSWDGTMRLWDSSTGALRRVYLGSGHITYVAFSPDGATLAMVGGDAAVRVWSAFPAADLSDRALFNQWAQAETSAALGADMELESP